MPELVFLNACKYISLKKFFVCVEQTGKYTLPRKKRITSGPQPRA
jgi:hypothetical protein